MISASVFTFISVFTLIWCLKHVKDFMFTLSVSGSFFSEKYFLNLDTMTLFSSHLGGCVDEVDDNWTNYQG